MVVAQRLCPQPRALSPKLPESWPGTCCHRSHPRKAGCGKEPGRIFSMGLAQGNAVGGGCSRILGSARAAQELGSDSERGAVPSSTLQQSLLRKISQHTSKGMGPCCEKGRRAGKKGRGRGEDGGRFLRTSGFLSTSPHWPHPLSLVLPTHLPGTASNCPPHLPPQLQGSLFTHPSGF